MGKIEQEKFEENNHSNSILVPLLSAKPRYEFDVRKKDERGFWRNVYTIDPLDSNYETRLNSLLRKSISTLFWVGICTNSAVFTAIYKNEFLSDSEFFLLIVCLEVLAIILSVSVVTSLKNKYTRQINNQTKEIDLKSTSGFPMKSHQ